METIEKIASDTFFSAIEISRINDSETRIRVRQIIAQSHMSVDCGAHPMILSGRLNLNGLDRAERDKAVESLLGYLPQAAEIGARSFVILSGFDPEDPEREEATKAFVGSLERLCRATAEYKIRLVLETFDRKVDKRALIGPANAAAAAATMVR